MSTQGVFCDFPENSYSHPCPSVRPYIYPDHYTQLETIPFGMLVSGSDGFPIDKNGVRCYDMVTRKGMYTLGIQTMVETLASTIARRILRARQNKRWSQGDLARATGIQQGTISRYESGERSRVSTCNLIKIADATGVTVDFLLGRTDIPDIAERMKRARALKGITPQQLADATGIPLRIIRQIESSGAGDLDPELLAKIAEATGVMVDFLLGVE